MVGVQGIEPQSLSAVGLQPTERPSLTTPKMAAMQGIEPRHRYS